MPLNLMAGMGVMIILAVFYTDWVLAAVEGNWAGILSSVTRVLWALYFLANRLPMLAF